MHSRIGFLITGALFSASLALVSVAADAEKGWRANPEQVERQSKGRPGINYDEEKVPGYTLPEALRVGEGGKIESKEEWEKRGRGATLELFREHVYGRSPGAGEVSFEVVKTDENAMEGKATLKQVRITSKQQGKSFAFMASLFVPNEREGKVPAFVLINNRPVASADPTRKEKNGFWPAEEIVARGYATAVFRTGDVDPDKNGAEARAEGVRGVFTPPGKAEEDGWATIAAWAWGASRVMDYLVTEEAIDATKVAVIGHSRGGKTALWAGAEDTRFAMAISNDSGCGGAAIERRKFGETIERINKSFPYWFCGNYKRFNGKEEELPVDTHQLIALMAPRAVAVGSADEDLWADPRGEFLGVAHASPVFGLYGNPVVKPEEMPGLDAPLNRGKMHYHVRSGGHNLTPYDWDAYMDFADGVWGRGR